MKKYTQEINFEKGVKEGESLLETMARTGAREMLALALEDEIREHLEKYKDLRDEKGRKLVVRNGYHPERDIITGIGPLTIRQPRVDDRKLATEERFSCKILPRYMRRAPSIDNLVPVLYLKGVSTNDFKTALASNIGRGCERIVGDNDRAAETDMGRRISSVGEAGSVREAVRLYLGGRNLLQRAA
jgi:putative transposase